MRSVSSPLKETVGIVVRSVTSPLKETVCIVCIIALYVEGGPQGFSIASIDFEPAFLTLL